MWDVLRYYLSLRGPKNQREWLDYLTSNNAIATAEDPFPVSPETVALLVEYLAVRDSSITDAVSRLRTEREALAYCRRKRIAVRKTATKSKDHHQASKSLIAAVSEIALRVADEVDPNPQTRCIWCNEHGLHVTARNLDGAIPSTANPKIIWEIKEYWGKTKGGSKMSDAVYECHLVGRELLGFEAVSGVAVRHVVFVDGKDQWAHRVSDLKRLLDLTHQGLIDRLFVGSDVETEWEPWLREQLGISVEIA